MRESDGSAAPFVAVVPVRRWLFVLLATTLAIGGRFPSFVLDRAALIHFGQWGLLSRPRGQRTRPGRLRSTLVFVSVFDGEVDQYIVTFASLLPLRFSQVFGFCVGYPGPVPSGPLLSYIDRHKHASPFFHAAYGLRTMCDIRGALWITEQLSRLTAQSDRLGQPGGLDARGLRTHLAELAAQRDRDARVVYRTPRWKLTRLAAAHRFGSTSFTTLTPVVRGRERELAERLAELQDDKDAHEAFAAIPTTHYARFACIDPLFDADDEPMPYAPAMLLFSAQFDRTDGPGDEVDRYAGRLFDHLDRLPFDPWSYCEGYPPDAPRRLFVDYLKFGAVPTGLFLPGVTATAAEISRAADVEERFERLRADHLDQPSRDDELVAAFAASFAGGER